MDVYRVAFTGQNKIRKQSPLITRIEDLLREKLHGKGLVEFYCGRDSDFDFLAALAAKCGQKEFENCDSRIVLLQPYPRKNDSDYDRLYDEFRYLAENKSNPKATATERNRWMVDHADLLVAYVKTNRRSEALTTLEYAQKKGIPIINLAEQEQ